MSAPKNPPSKLQPKLQPEEEASCQPAPAPAGLRGLRRLPWPAVCLLLGAAVLLGACSGDGAGTGGSVGGGAGSAALVDGASADGAGDPAGIDSGPVAEDASADGVAAEGPQQGADSSPLDSDGAGGDVPTADVATSDSADSGGASLPDWCPEPLDPGPAATDVSDSCASSASPVTAISDLTGFDHLAVDIQGASDFGVAAARYGPQGEVRFWHLAELVVASEDVWPAAVEAGPWVVRIGDASYAVVWGEADGVRFARPGGQPVTTTAGVAPAAVYARQGGTRVLVRGEQAWELVGTDEEGASLDGHLVANNAKVDRIWLNVDGDLVVVAFTQPGAEQGLGYLTGAVQGGQCSLPAPYNLELGPDAELLDIGAGYGLSAFAWRTTPPAGCPVASRIHVRLFGMDGAEFDSAVPFGDQVRWTSGASVATAVTLVGAPGGGWQAAGQSVDLPTKTPGQVVSGPVVPEQQVPVLWELARDRGQHVIVWQGAGGLQLQRFCF